MLRKTLSLLSRHLRREGYLPADDVSRALAPVPIAIDKSGDDSGSLAAVPRAKEEPEYVAAATMDDIVRIEEVSHAEFFIGDLFRRKFGGDPPDYPKCFVAF